jgi:tRNA (guanine-N7-)-methyltransferase
LHNNERRAIVQARLARVGAQPVADGAAKFTIPRIEESALSHESSNTCQPGTHRSVRSFVRRAGRITSAQRRAFDDLWPRYGLEFSAIPLDLQRAFGRPAERVLEIGFGDGESLVQQAAGNPELDYLGIEVHRPGVGHCLLQAEAQGIGNVRLISHDAIEVLKQQLPDRSLRRINLYFPDPWPKKRHHKRRLVQADFLKLAAGKLEQGGALHIATDWDNYAEHIDEVVAGSDEFLVRERRVHDGDRPLDRPTTKFERRGLALGHRITEWRLDRKR